VRAGPRHPAKKGLIEQAYTFGERVGIPVWNEDEAGPYQAIPHPGPSWQPQGEPARQPHEYIRGGTAKLLTLFHPATGAVRAQPVVRATHDILHPWLLKELEAILSEVPEVAPQHAQDWGRRWSDWGWPLEWAQRCDWPPVRMVLIWDNLVGHYTPQVVTWCHYHGIALLYTPLGGSWLNMAESVQRILVRRALSGQHPKEAQQIMDWLAAVVCGWNADPTPFEWGGKRWQRRQRQRERHKLGGSAAYTRRPIRRRWQSGERVNPLCHPT